MSTAEQPLRAWLDEIGRAEWESPADIEAHYRSASFVHDRRVVFDIKGKDFRLIVSVPIEAIKFRMEQESLTVADMKPYIGPPNRVYEVLSRKRGLSLGVIKRLHAGLGITADALIG